jgi:hypothetical protein
VALAGAMARRRRCSSPAKEHRVLAADLNLYAALETKRIIEGEGGICEAASGDVSLAPSTWRALPRLRRGVGVK